MTDAAPLIVTLALDDAAQAAFEADRQRHFPPALNRIPAHVSLFHHLPGDAIAAIGQRMHALADTTARFTVQVDGPMLLGRGVAWRLRSNKLNRLHANLAQHWIDWLTPQDRQPYRPHVTIQNKVTPEAAKTLFAEKQQDFQPYEITATGLRLWHYRDGPWEAAGRFAFEQCACVRTEV